MVKSSVFILAASFALAALTAPVVPVRAETGAEMPRTPSAREKLNCNRSGCRPNPHFTRHDLRKASKPRLQ